MHLKWILMLRNWKYCTRIKQSTMKQIVLNRCWMLNVQCLWIFRFFCQVFWDFFIPFFCGYSSSLSCVSSTMQTVFPYIFFPYLHLFRTVFLLFIAFRRFFFFTFSDFVNFFHIILHILCIFCPLSCFITFARIFSSHVRGFCLAHALKFTHLPSIPFSFHVTEFLSVIFHSWFGKINKHFRPIICSLSLFIRYFLVYEYCCLFFPLILYHLNTTNV